LYDWVDVPLGRSNQDQRPESRRVLREEDVNVVGHVGTEGGWRERRNTVFKDPSWQFASMEDLFDSQQARRTSLGLIPVGDVRDVRLVRRPAEEQREHDRKLLRLQSQTDLFREPQPDLEFFPFRVEVVWRCEDSSRCNGHKMAVLDWGLSQLGRRDGPEVAKARMEEIANLDEYDLHFFTGNFVRYQQNFGVVGVWYPKKTHMAQTDLF
jgi:hypothetical protein